MSTLAEVEVRAYDLGGFGDIAGALRVASHLASGGLKTVIRPTSSSALAKLNILKSDVEITPQPKSHGIRVDVAGHYRDSRREGDVRETPHHFTEDMDNPGNRNDFVPLYLKTGMVGKGRQLGERFGGMQNNPMFYRPLREWDLPKPHERDVREQILVAMGKEKKQKGFDFRHPFRRPLERLLDSVDNFAFAHFNPELQDFFSHPYIQSLEMSTKDCNTRTALGLFLPQDTADKMVKNAIPRGYTVFRRGGEYIRGDPRMPALLFLGPQSQLTTTSLFLSANIPNLVTGDLSLSDALYGLIAMEGPGFFYDCPGWKLPTLIELQDIFHRVHPELANIFLMGGGGYRVVSDDETKMLGLRGMVARILSGDHTQVYRDAIRIAVIREIAYRFGDFQIHSDGSPEGFYIPRGSPFLIQDATEGVIHALMDHPDVFAEVEQRRRRLAGERSPVVVVPTEVMVPQAQTSPMGQIKTLLSSGFDYFGHKIYKEISYIIPTIYENKPEKEFLLHDILYEKLSKYTSPLLSINYH